MARPAGGPTSAAAPEPLPDRARILIVQTSFLGDVVLSTPTFAAVRRHYPHAHITVLVRPEAVGLLADHPSVDAVLIDDKRGADRGFGALRTLERVRAGQFDVALALHKSFRTAWLLAASRIGLRIGFRQSLGWFFYHRRVRRDPRRHDVVRNLSVLAGLGIDPEREDARPYLACSDEARQRFAALLRAQGVRPDAVLIGVAPGSVWATKRWTVDGFSSLLELIRDDLRATPVLLGARSDAVYADAIQFASRDAAINLVGATDLALLIAAIDACRVLVTNDSAPMHIAVARDTPVVAIFGPTSPAQGYGPYTERATIVEHAIACRPCGRHGAVRCPIGTHACMTELTADAVAKALFGVLHRWGDVPRRAPGEI